jgi:hypothetical protein
MNSNAVCDVNITPPSLLVFLDVFKKFNIRWFPAPILYSPGLAVGQYAFCLPAADQSRSNQDMWVGQVCRVSDDGAQFSVYWMQETKDSGYEFWVNPCCVFFLIFLHTGKEPQAKQVYANYRCLTGNRYTSANNCGRV